MFSFNRQVGRLLLGVAFFYGFVATDVAVAQVGTGSIQGTVSDSSGAIIAGASVTVTNTQTGGVTPITANTQGRYAVPDLLVGTYDVQAKMTGFQTQIHTGVVITVGQNVVVDFSLPVGQVTETVTVQGATTQVETTSAEISAQIGQQQVEQLPLNGRNYEQLILLAPGVQTVTTGAQSSFYGREPSYSIAGSRPEGQELLLDGANIQGFWNHGAGNSIIGTSLGVEAIGEFQVLTNSYSARFGGSGSVMNATTKSGTNTLPRQRVRLLPQQCPRCPRYLQHHRFADESVSTESIRRSCRRSDQERQAILLRKLRRHSKAARIHLASHGP